jgi:hypothetical protein
VCAFKLFHRGHIHNALKMIVLAESKTSRVAVVKLGTASKTALRTVFV